MYQKGLKDLDINMKPKQQGFQESDDERLVSKLHQKNNQNQMSNTFFVMPQAKPLLSKNNIDMGKPKVLIKQIQICTEPVELLSSNHHKEPFSSDRAHNSKQQVIKASSVTTIWEKYILSQLYQIKYLKYYKDEISQLTKKGFKKFKVQLQKLCRNQSYLFSTYIIDFSFLSDAGSYLLRNLKPTSFQQIIQTPLNEKIKFDSRFENGNLFAVFQKKNSTLTNVIQYDLILQSDINSKGYSNWFYFNTRNQAKGTVKFNIINMQKSHSLFSQGMKVAVYSMKRHKFQNLQWHRDGYGYLYYKNQLRKNNQNQSTYYTLSFNYDFKYEQDVVYFAANLPYSYSKMLKYIQSIQKVARLNSNIYFKKENISNSISSNSCPVITLTWKREKRKDQKKKKKKIIGVIARQHPSQTVSSYVAEGFINSLVYLNSQSSVDLLQNYIFKIIPMVNIDGVIYGNSRCDISGSDINRKWTKNPNKAIYPIISSIKSIFQKLIQEQYQIDYFIDLHGHSRKMGAFVYGCKAYDQFQSRQTAWILSKLNSKVLFQQCQFGLSQFKKETARGVMCDLVTGKKSMTIQTSSYGYKTISSKHWDPRDLEKIGSSLIQAIYAQTSKDPKIFNWQTLKLQLKQAVQNQSKKKVSNQKQGSQSSFGSDSNPSQDELTPQQKSQYFLDPTVATKIGLNEVKIINKKQRIQNASQKKQQLIQNIQAQKYQMIVDGFKEKLQFMNSQKSDELKIYKESVQQNLKQKNLKQKGFVVRHTKSTTKILPFKFTQRPERLQAQKEKQSRKSVQILIKRPQKLSIPELPRVESKSNFWSNLKKQYQSLLYERKSKNFP